MKAFNKLYEALTRMVIHVLENQHVSKYEAIFIVFLNSLLEIGILFSDNFDYPASNLQYVSILFSYAQLFNTTQLIRSYGFSPTSIGLLSILSAVCLLLLILTIYVYSFFYRGNQASTSHRVLLWLFEQILKYVGYCLSIPFLHCFITAIGAGLPETILAIFGITTISIPLLVERILIQEDNFLDTHYLCKRNTILNLLNVGYFVFIMTFESHFPTGTYRLTYTIIAFVWQLYRLWRVFTFDYYFFQQIQKLNIFCKALIAPVSFIFLLNYCLQVTSVRTLSPTEWTILIMFFTKLIVEVHSLYERKVLANYRNPQRAYQADHAIKLLLNQAQLIFNKNIQEYDYSSSDLLTRDVLFHKGLIASDFHNSYRKKSMTKIWKKDDLYDPATFSFFRPHWRAQRQYVVKDTPSNSIIALKHFLRALYAHYTNQFPHDPYLHLSFASYLLHYLRLTPAVIIECFILSEEMQKKPDARISISRERLVRIVNTIQERLARERSDITFSNIDIKGIAELEAKYSKMIDMMNEYIKDYLIFLEEMSDEEMVSFDVAFKTGKRLLTIRKNIERIFGKCLSENPFSMAAYSEFLRSVLSEDVRAIEVLKQYQRVVGKLEIYVRADKDCFDINLLFDKNSSIIQASGLSENLGKILKSNTACERLFCYTQKEFQAMNIRNLTPRLIALQHDAFLTNYIDSGRENLIYTNRKLYGRDKGGFVFPMTLIVKPQVDLSTGGFLFLGYLKNINTKNEFIITDQFGLVDSVSKVLGEALGLDRTFLDENLVQMQLICPETAELFEISSETRSVSFKGKALKNKSNNDTFENDDEEGKKVEGNKANTDQPEGEGNEEEKSLLANTNNRSHIRLLQQTEKALKFLKCKSPLEYVAGTLTNKAKNIMEFYTKAQEAKDSSKESSDLSFSTDQRYLSMLNAKIKQTRKAKNYCLVQGAVEEFRTSKNNIKIYVFKFTEIEDLFKEKIQKHTLKRTEASTKQSSLKNAGEKINSRIEKGQKVPGLLLNKLTQFKEAKDDFEKSGRLKLAALDEEDEAEDEYLDRSPEDLPEDRGINLNFEHAAKNQLPRLLSDISAIFPASNHGILSHRDAEVRFDLDNLDGGEHPNPRNFLQTNRNDSSFEVNLSARSQDSVKKSPRSEISDHHTSKYIEKQLEILDNDLKSKKEVSKEIQVQKSHENANESIHSEALDSHRALQSARSKLGASPLITERNFDALLVSQRGLLDSERQESITDKPYRLEVRGPESTSTKIDSKGGSEEPRFNHGSQLMKEIDPTYLQKIVVIEDEKEEYSSDMASSMKAVSDSLRNPAQSSSKKNIKDIFRIFNQNPGKASGTAEKKNKKGGIIKSKSSSITSGTYGSKMVHSAIINTYYPIGFRHSQMLVVTQLAAAIFSLIVLIIISLVKFSYLQYSTQILDNVNRLVYMVHQMGSAAYDLENNGEILRDTPEGIMEKATQTLLGINTSYYALATELYDFQGQKPYFFNTFPTFRTSILLQEVVVDTKYNISVPMDEFFEVIQYDAFDVLSEFNDIVEKIDRTSVNTLLNDYKSVVSILVQWTTYFNDNSSLSVDLTTQINSGTIAVSIILFILTVSAIYKLFVGMRFINLTLYQLSYVTPIEYSDIKNRILSFRRNLNNKISLNNESAAIQALSDVKLNKKARDATKRSQGTKRKYGEAKIYFFRRALPIFLLFSFYMVIEGSFKAAMDSVTSSLNLGMSSILFFANDEANAIYGITRFKNYTLESQANLTTEHDLQTLLNYYNKRINSITSQYVSAVSQIQEIFTPDEASTLENLIYGDVCPLYPSSNCTAVLSGAFSQGLIAGRIAINKDMINELGVNSFPIDEYYVFEELNQAETLGHNILLDILQISSNRIQDLINSGIKVVSGLMAGLVFASVLFFWLLWSYTMKNVMKEFQNSRKMLSLVPIILILRNQRIMSFLKKTSSSVAGGRN